MEFRPCIDIHNGKVKQIIGSTLTDTKNEPSVNFESPHTPSYYSEMYRKDNLKGGHIIKLGPNNEEAAESALKAWPNGMQIGGGITSENAQYYLDLGARHVIVTSYVFSDGKVNFKNLNKLVDTIGRNKLVLDLSCKERDGKYYIVTDRWQNWTEVVIDRDTLELLGSYCAEFLVHAASVEGKMQGPDLKLVEILGKFSPVPVTYAGGITTRDDIRMVKKHGKDLVNITIGSSLDIFGGELPYRVVVALCR